MKQYTYLIINVLTVFFPVVLSFDRRVAFAKTWRFIWPGMAITGLVFLFWDVMFTVYSVWSFSPYHIIGLKFFGLPLEEILFFLTVPFACIFIYACLNHYVKWQLPRMMARNLSIALIVLSMVLCVIYHDRLYTVVTFALLPVILFVTLKKGWLSRFYLAYFVSLIPFYIVNGLLTSIPVVLYNNDQNMGIRITTIPFEDHFYSMALLLMNIAFYEHFKKRHNLSV